MGFGCWSVLFKSISYNTLKIRLFDSLISLTLRKSKNSGSKHNRREKEAVFSRHPYA